MTSLKKILSKKGYIAIDFKRTKTNHIEIKAKINGIKGRFILDTGASNSCLGIDVSDKFKLDVTDSEIKAAGAGAINMETQASKKNSIKIGKWAFENLNLIIFNLTHVNTALLNHGAKTVDGIIGADVLDKGSAIIDYKKERLYLKRLVFKY